MARKNCTDFEKRKKIYGKKREKWEEKKINLGLFLDLGTSIQMLPLPTSPTTSNISQEGVSRRVHNSGGKIMEPTETDRNQIVQIVH